MLESQPNILGEPAKYMKEAAKYIGEPAKQANTEEPDSRAPNEYLTVKNGTAQTQPNPGN